jgi:hypothetical protein
MIEVKAVNNLHNKKPSMKWFPELPDDEVVYKPIIDGKELNYIAETADIALLIGLGYKYDGANSRFAMMACRMLKIKSVYTD